MPINPTYPGVYIEELENPIKTIVGVSTSVTAFVGRALQGPVDEPTLIHNFGEFESIFGGLWKDSTMSYAVYQYFLNGGMDAVIIRVVHADDVTPNNNAAAATFTNAGGGPTFVATNPGGWANKFKVVIDYDVDASQDDPLTPHLFNLRVFKDTEEAETYLNISHKPDHKRYVLNVLKEESDYVRVEGSPANIGTLTGARPVIGDYTGSGGNDGIMINETDITGSPATKTGIYALDRTDIFNLLCIPPADPDGAAAGSAHYATVYTAASTYCITKRAVLIVDPPNNWNAPSNVVSGIETVGLSRSENAAIYYPNIRAPDPKKESRLREFPPCGVIAGIIAKTDAQRGVWKAPAGIETILTGVPELEYRMTDGDSGSLNPLGVNCLRVMPPAGRVVWGARTMRGADRLTNQWKYLPVRRTALYIEETLYRNTQWVVFEPNDEPLWAQIRLSVGAFMQDLFKKGAFQGTTPKEAYLVKCDKETTTQYDIDRGIVNILVGFAPLKPAEFVMIKIQQLAGQAEAK